MEQMQQIEAIASALNGGTLSRAEKSGLYNELADEENVYALVVGTASQKGSGPLSAQVAELGERHLVALTDQRLVLLATSDGGIKQVSSHPREEVKSVRLRPGVAVSEMQVIIGGAAAWVISSVAAMDAQRFVETARDALHLPVTIGDEPADAESAAERELKELKRMLDEGTITREEYEQLRKPILERMGYQEEDEEKKSKTGIIVGVIVAVVMLILLIGWMLASGGDDDQDQDELGDDEEVTDETQPEDQDEAPADQGGAGDGAGEQPDAPAQQAPAEEPPVDQPQDQQPPAQQEPEDEAAEDEDDGFWPGWPWEWDIFEEDEDQAEEEAPVQEEPEQDESADDGTTWPWEDDGAWPWEDEGEWPWE